MKSDNERIEAFLKDVVLPEYESEGSEQWLRNLVSGRFHKLLYVSAGLRGSLPGLPRTYRDLLWLTKRGLGVSRERGPQGRTPVTP
jgi:hypothetical protein